MDDESIMPWGKHKGEAMANVPANYLLYLFKNEKCSGQVKQYIEDNLDILTKETV